MSPEGAHQSYERQTHSTPSGLKAGGTPAPLKQCGSACLAGLLLVWATVSTQLIGPDVVVPFLLGCCLALWTGHPAMAGGLGLGIWGVTGLLLRPPGVPFGSTRLDLILLESSHRHFLLDWPQGAFTAVSFLSLGLGLALGQLASRPLSRGLVIGFLLLGFAGSVAIFNPAHIRKFAGPPPPTYAFDTMIYSATLEMMRNGTDFWMAHAQAHRRDPRTPEITAFRYWRSPLYYQFWNCLPDYRGLEVVTAYVVLVTVAMVCGFRISSRVAGPDYALLAPVLMSPFFLYAVVEGRFYSTEFWSGCLGLIALDLFTSKRTNAALWTAAVAVMGRELYIFFFAGMALEAWLRDYARRVVIVAAAAAIVAFHVLHFAMIAVTMGGAQPLGATEEMTRWEGLRFVWACLMFGFLLVPFRQALVALVAALGLAGLARMRPERGGLTLALAVLGPTAMFTVVNHAGQWVGQVYHIVPDYWGMLITPWLLLLVPVAIGRADQE